MKHRLLITAALFIPAVASAQTPPSFDPARLSRHVQTLSSDAFEGRGPATRGEKMTVDYLVRELTAAGVQPGGDLVNGTRGWTQAVPLLKADINGAPTLALTVGGTAIPLTQGNEIAVRAPMNGAKNVALANAPLVFVGYGVTAPERGWDDYKGADVRGKIAVMLINDPDFEGGEGEFGGKAMTYYGRWTYKYEEAAKRGAAGVMIIHETEPASYGWNTVKNSNTNTMFDIVRKDPAAAHTAFESWIQRDLAVRLFGGEAQFLAAKAAARRKDFTPVPLAAKLDARYDATTSVITSYNVAGLLRGTRRPDETVIYSAHHDHIGIGQPDANGDRIFNGAIDNGTGVAHLLEQARAFARAPRTDRSVVFLAVGAEEKGLLGTEYYVANPIYPLGKTVAVLNTDSMGVAGPARNFSISGTARLELLDRLTATARQQGRTFTPDPRPEAGGFFRSDHFPFAKRGVPAISFRSGNDLVNGGTARGDALTADYTAKRYHQQDDEFEPGWDFSGIVQDAQLLYAVGRDLANSTAWPNWSQDSEFRAVRDASEAERTAAPVASGERG
ncbi:MAG: M28 family metallopeptidase [Pseudomonadota bacterium]|nr:M28 family metallopeptidase [Pseudomonadota bacterium]